MSPSDQTLVSRGGFARACRGTRFTSPGVRPASAAEDATGGKSIETWIYYDTSVGNYYPGAFAYGPYAGFGYGYGYGGGFGYSRYLRRRFYGGFAYDPFYDPFFYNRVSVLRYPERTVSFENGRVIAISVFPGAVIFISRRKAAANRGD